MHTTNSRFVRKTVSTSLAALMALPSFANNLSAGAYVGSTDFAMFGVGGLRGTGNGTITVSGISGSVTRAILLWHGLSASTTASASNGTFGGSPFVGSNIGISENNCWGAATSQAFQADVTSAVTGNGAFALSIPAVGGQTPNGASLLVFYNDGNPANNRDVAVFWGNDSNQTNTYDTAGWSATMGGINYTSGPVTMNLIVSDGQNNDGGGSNTLRLNTTNFTVPNFAGGSLPTAPGSSITVGGLWDHAAVNVTSVMIPGANTLTLSSPAFEGDCLSLIGAVFDLPGGSVVTPPIVTPPVVTPPVVIAPSQPVPAWSAIGFGGTGLAAALWGMYALRRREKDSAR